MAGRLLWSRVVEGRPIPQQRAKVDSRPARNGKRRRARVFHPDGSSRAFRAWLVLSFRSSSDRLGFGPARLRISEPVEVEIFLAGANLAGDGDNHSKQILDALVTAEVLAGDSLRIVRRLVVEAIDEVPAMVSVRISRRFEWGRDELFSAAVVAAGKVWGVSPGDVVGRDRSMPARKARAAIARRMHGVGFGLAEIGALLNRRATTPGALELRLAVHLLRDNELRAELERFEALVAAPGRKSE